MKSLKIVVLFLMLGMVFGTTMTGCLGRNKIDAGYDGIRVNKYGDEKGVDNISEVTGVVWYNTIKYDIYEVPTFMQDYEMPNMTFTTKDMMDVTLSASAQVQNPAGKTPGLFIKYRRYFKDGDVDLTPIIYKYTRQGFSDAVGRFEAEELLTKKTVFRLVADSLVTLELEALGFEVGDIFLVGDPDLPASIKTAVNDKIKADQLADMKQKELMQVEYDTQKIVIKAKADSTAMIATAQAEAAAYALKNRELSMMLIQQQFIEKWNGVLPVYGEVPSLFKGVTGK